MDTPLEAAEAEMVEWFDSMNVAGGWLDPEPELVVAAFLEVLLEHPGFRREAVALLTAMGR